MEYFLILYDHTYGLPHFSAVLEIIFSLRHCYGEIFGKKRIVPHAGEPFQNCLAVTKAER